MQISHVAITVGLIASAVCQSDPASELKSSDFAGDEGNIRVRHVIYPEDDGGKPQVSRGPGGYTDDEETWSCLDDCDMEPSDCDALNYTISDMGGPNGWWWIPSSTGCNSWKHDNCKAIFCPLDTAKDKYGNPIQEDMVVSTTNLAKQMGLLAAICAQDGRRAHMKADNGSWEFWLAEGGFSPQG